MRVTIVTPPACRAEPEAPTARVAAFQAERLGPLGFEVEVLDVSADCDIAALCARALSGDLVHVHLPSTRTGPAGARLAARLVSGLAPVMPVAVTMHASSTDLEAQPHPIALEPPAPLPRLSGHPASRPRAPWIGDAGPGDAGPGDGSRRGIGAALCAAAAVVVPSATEARRLIAALPELEAEGRHPRVLPHGVVRTLPVDSSAAERAPRAPWGGARPLRVLHWGGLAPARGTYDLVAACGLLPAGAVEVALGGPGLPRELVAFAAARAPHVPLHWLGPVAGEALARWARDADLAAFPGSSCGYDLAVDEALALGLPTWLASTSAAHTRIGAAGRVLQAGRPDCWAHELAGLARRPDALEREARAARATAQRIRHSADNAAVRLGALFRELVSGVPGGPGYAAA